VISISSPLVRACDFQVDVGGRPTTKFAEHVRGTFLQRGDRLAVSLVSRKDLPLGAAVELVWPAASKEQKAENLTGDCYDALGLPVVEPGISLKVGR
jgi:hypothetical protein